jgi:hypothetical protein
MDPLRYLAETVGFFTRAQAREAGHDDRAIAASVHHQVWLRFRHGYYTFHDLWAGLDDVGRHRVLCAAVLDSMGPTVALSHVSALVAHGVPIWGLPLDKVHVTRLDGGAGRIEAGVVHHVGRWLQDDIVDLNGRLVMVPDRAAIEAASRADNEVALCVFDAALYRKLFDYDQLARRFEVMQHWPFVRHLHVSVRIADGRAATIGESRGRWLFRSTGIPAPVLQYEVYDADGVLIGTCDYGWPEHRALGEFDGKIKYGRLLKPGQEPGEVVFAEKEREDLLREVTGYRMIRLTWQDYFRPALTARRVRRTLRIAS